MNGTGTGSGFEAVTGTGSEAEAGSGFQAEAGTSFEAGTGCVDSDIDLDTGIGMDLS